IWSESSVTSDWVRSEADFGRSRQVLVAVRIDRCKLPFGFRTYQVDDLSNWVTDTPPEGIVGVLDRVRELVEEAQDPDYDRREKDEQIRLQQKRTQTEHISVSDHERDQNAVLTVMAAQPDEAKSAIVNGYRALEAAQHAALFDVNERAPL